MLAVRHRSSLVPTSIPLAWGRSGVAIPNRIGSEPRLDFTRIRVEWQTKRFNFSITNEYRSPRGLNASPIDLRGRPPEHTQVTWPQSKALEDLDQFGRSEYTFDAVFLRDACSCERCVDPSTTQKTFDSADIPYDIRPKSLERDDDGIVRIVWEPDILGFEGHVSVYGPSFDFTNRNLQSRLVSTSSMLDWPIRWDSKRMSERQLTVDYADYMSSSSVLLSSLRHLFEFGLLFIHSIPFDTDAVSHIARRIGPVKETLYGSTWDVRSVPSAKNVAYTSSHLGFHMVSRDRVASNFRVLNHTNRICCTLITLPVCRFCIVSNAARQGGKASSVTLFER